MNDSLILLIVIPFIGALVCLGGKFFRPPWLAPGACAVTIITCGVQLVYVYPALLHERQVTYIVGGWPALIGIHQFFDGLAWIGCVLVMIISFLVLLFAIAEQHYSFTFYFFYLLMISGMTGVLLAADLFNMFVFFEILGITSYILIAYFQERQALVASLKYLLLSSVGIVFFLIGIFIIYQQTGSLTFHEIAEFMSKSHHNAAHIHFALAVLVAGISVRTAYIPFHVWLPEAYASAPHPVSAILAGAVGKVSFLVIWRLILTFEAAVFRAGFLWFGAATALIAVIYALSQIDCKKLLAWHSISQVGYILVGFGVGQTLASVGSVYHLVNHALFKSLLFLCIGVVISRTSERCVKHLSRLGRLMPGLMGFFVVGALSISGIPGFNGFISKKLIESSVSHSPTISVVLWLTGIGTIASFLKLSAIFRNNPYHPTLVYAEHTLTPVSWFTYAPLLLLSLFCILTGIAGVFFSGQIFRVLFGEPVTDLPQFYSLANIAKTGVSAALGYGLYRFVVSSAGGRYTTRIRQFHLTFQTGLIIFLLTLMMFAIIAGSAI